MLIAAGVGSYGVRRLVSERVAGIKGVLALMLAGGLGFAFTNATIGTLSICLFGILPFNLFGAVWHTWWLGDAAGVFLVAPLLLAWLPANRELRSPRRAEAILCLGMIALVGFVIFGGDRMATLRTLPKDETLALPFFIWAAFRLNLRTLTLGIVLFATMAVVGTATGGGPFQRTTPGDSLLVLDAVLSCLTCACLCMAALVRESQTNMAGLAASEEKFSKSFRSSPLAIVVSRLDDGTILDANDSFLAMHGFNTRAEVIGRNTLDLGLWPEPGDREMLVARLRLERRALNLKRTFRRICGETRTGLYSLELIELAGQSCVLLLVNDITERERAEAALRLNELHLRLMAEIIAGYSFSYQTMPDQSLQLEWMSQAGEKVLGYTEMELKTSVKFRDCIHPDDRTEHRAKLNLVLSGILQVMDFRFRTKSGNYRWLRYFSRPEWDADREKIIRIVGAGQDITELKSAEADREQLVIQLHQSENAERRRIARDLHDSTAQQLAIIKLNLSLIRKNHPAFAIILDDSITLTDQSIQEIRNLTWLLHPPLLDDLGLASALKAYADGFTRRSEISVTVETEKFSGRLPAATELALFRVAQESLTNIMRHANSPHAVIRLQRNHQTVSLEIQDTGNGMVLDETKSGVGIAGMRERLRLVGGNFSVKSSPSGTIITATVPINAAARTTASQPA